jgi:HK97 gp10 family phage protein
MADAIKITIKNLPQIKAAFSKAPGLMSKELNMAIKKSVFHIQAKSMINTPVLTSRLRSSHRSKFENLKGEVSTNTIYDIFVHNGTRFMKARPFMLQAVESSDAEVNRFFTQAVDSVLNDIGKAT